MNIGDNTERISRLQEIGNIGNWELDLATGKAIWSDEACRIYGITAKDNEVSYAQWEACMHPDDLERVLDAMETSKNNLKSFSVQHRIIRPDGSMAHIYTYMEYMLDANGLPIGIYGITNDITNVINLKNELVKSESNIKLMMNLIPISVYARDADGYYIFANNVFLKHYGISVDQLQGKHLREYVRNETEYKILKEQDETVLRTGTALYINEFRQTDHEGIEKIWRIIKVPFMPEGHDKKAVLGIAEDITERYHYQANLKRFARSLEERNKSLEEYSFMVSHELRGPLSTIMGISEVINTVTLSQNDLAFFVHGLQTSLTKLDDVIRKMNNLLTADTNSLP